MSQGSFLAQHEFLLRRLHSLTGLVPVGAYMCVHLAVNASLLDGAATFQRNVYQIHNLGDVLPIVEWVFIFLPLLFHGILGLVFLNGASPNLGAYKYASNFRYSAQRASGLIAFAFIAWHVFHMHGWIHADWWLENVAAPLQGALFKPYNAASTASAAMQASVIVPILYAIGILACVFHLANGVWTAGITWGLWIDPKAQKNAGLACTAFGLIVALVGMSALAGTMTLDVERAAEVENEMYEFNTQAGLIKKNDHKRSHHDDDHHSEPDKTAARDAPEPNSAAQ